MSNTSGLIIVDVPCDRAYTICVTSSTGCKGSMVLNAFCPCPGDLSVDLPIEGSYPACNCTP